MREFKSISASQLSRFSECRRAWWFQYIMGLPTKQKPSAALGEAVHTVLERYLDDGVLPDTSTQAGRIAAPGLQYLPKPGTVFTEVSMSGKGRGNASIDEDSVPVPGGMPRLIVAGMPVNGFIDVLDLSGDRPVVLDHKTTSDLKWAKTENDLREDPQMILYGSYALDVFSTMGLQVETVETGHIVYLTKGAPAARKTTVTLTRAHLASERKKLASTVEEMKTTAQARTPASVEGEASVCDKYGGCDFRDKCGALGMFANATAFTSMFKAQSTTSPVQKENDTMSNVDPLAAIAALRAKKAAAAANPAPAVVEAPAPAPAPVAVETPAPSANTGSAAASILARYGVKVPTAAPAAAPVAAAVPAPVEAEEAGDKKTVRKPRDYQTKLTALEWTTEQINRMSAESMRAAIDGSLNGRAYSVRPDGSIYVPGVGALDTATIPAGEMPFESEEDEATFLKVFPEEAANVASAKAPEASKVMPSESVHPSQQVAVVAPAAPVVAPAAPVAVPEVAPVPAPVVKPPVLTLYIDCAPEKGRDKDYILLEDYIQPLLPQVVEAYNRGCKRDDEKVPFYSLIPYARGPGFVAALVMAAPPVGVIVANTRFPATNSILEVLIPMADVVVRGTR
jgi:RecB family exonuclease